MNGTPHQKAIELSILRFIRDEFGFDVPSPETNLIEAGALDSMMVVDLVMHIEQQFQITTMLEDLDLDNFASVANLARFVAARTPAVDPTGR